MSVGSPWVYVTLVPRFAAARIPCSGVTLNGAVTWALPPPLSVGAAEAEGPITATAPAPDAGSGSIPPVSFSSTMPGLGHVGGDLLMCPGSRHGARGALRLVEFTEPEHLGEDPGHHLAERRDRDLARTHGRGQRGAVVPALGISWSRPA